MPETQAEIDQLSDDERVELAVCERVIDDPHLARGAALRVIRDKRLYGPDPIPSTG